jgi:hypothetical protein
MKTLRPNIKYSLLDFLDPDDSSIFAVLGEKLWKYKSIKIFFGQFESVARQEAGQRTLSLNKIEQTQQDWAGEVQNKLKYIYEPNIVSISEKFSKAIFMGIFEQTLKEDQLAKSASRLMHLDKSLNKVEKNLIKANKYYQKLSRRKAGKKQQLQTVGHKFFKKTRRNYV